MKYFLKDRVEINGASYNFAYDTLNKRFLILDEYCNKICIMKLVEDSLKLIDTIQLEPDISFATSIAVNKNGQIFLACPRSDEILIFNNKFEREKEINEINLRDVNYLRLSENGDEIFLQANRENTIKMFNVNTGKLIREFPFEFSWHISVGNCKLFIIFKNLVYIYDTNTGKLLNTLTYDGWKRLIMLFVDDESNLYVLTKDDKESFYAHLYVFNREFKFSRKIEVDFDFYEIDSIWDMMIIGENLFLMANDSDDYFYLHRFIVKD